MRRFNSRHIAGVCVPVSLAVALLFTACRREPEPLDRNRPPETFLTVAPTEMREYEYRVHLFWHGEDQDGVVERFIYYRSDTLRTRRPDLQPQLELLDWNPALRRSDYLKGTITTRTDTVLIFTGFDEATSARVKRQAFHIAAIDDGGKIDPSPARIEFFAGVSCVPEVEFWVESETLPLKPYQPAHLDTIGMFEPFSVRFIGRTCNNVVTGYQWTYRDRTYPARDQWYIPSIDPPETLEVVMPNRGADVIPSGMFTLRAVARDEAGALSETDFVTGKGLFRVVVNRDPETKIIYGENFFTNRAGVADTTRPIYFSRTRPDTLPYNSLLRIHYTGWDDPRDNLQYTNPPIPIRFQFKFERWAMGLRGGVSRFSMPWLPEMGAENTNCYADIDSTTMRIGSNNYLFMAKSFDEQGRFDHTPDTIMFYGNFKPAIRTVTLAFDSIPSDPNVIALRKIDSDVLYIGLDKALQTRGDTCTAYDVRYSPVTNSYTFFYRFFIVASGHDDPRDPPGSAIHRWWYSLKGEQNYPWLAEEEWLSSFAPDTFQRALLFTLVVPRDPDADPSDPLPRPDPGFVANQPLWLGPQELTVIAADLPSGSTFTEEIRAISPRFVSAEGENPSCAGRDPNCKPLEWPGRWDGGQRRNANYARTDTLSRRLQIKLVY